MNFYISIFCKYFKNIFTKKSFFISFLITIGIFIFLLILLSVLNHSCEVFFPALLFFYKPYFIFGTILSLILIKKYNSVAWGIFLGCLIPLFLKQLIFLLH